MPLSQIQKPASDFLGTLNTTSGSVFTLSELDLSDYKKLRFVVKGFSTAAAAQLMQNGQAISQTTGTGGLQIRDSTIEVDLKTGLGSLNDGAAGGIYASGLSNASNSISFSTSASTGDAGTIDIYGER